jgi:hypothetical protein
VIAGNDEFVLMRKVAQPLKIGKNLISGFFGIFMIFPEIFLIFSHLIKLGHLLEASAG